MDCKNCKHFKRDIFLNEDYEEDNTKLEDFGKCMVSIDLSEKNHKQYPTYIFLGSSDYDHYKSRVIVHKDFGCKLFEN
jgi:hypothetical protein